VQSIYEENLMDVVLIGIVFIGIVLIGVVFIGIVLLIVGENLDTKKPPNKIGGLSLIN
jgi:hypothetical protein